MTMMKIYDEDTKWLGFNVSLSYGNMLREIHRLNIDIGIYSDSHLSSRRELVAGFILSDVIGCAIYELKAVYGNIDSIRHLMSYDCTRIAVPKSEKWFDVYQGMLNFGKSLEGERGTLVGFDMALSVISEDEDTIKSYIDSMRTRIDHISLEAYKEG